MYDLKFFALLRTLSKLELAAFHKYLRQLHGDEEIALAVFDYVRKFYPGFRDEKKLDTGYIHRKLFGSGIGKNDPNRKRLLNLLHDLHQHLRDFLLLAKMKEKEEPVESRTLWLKVLHDRRLSTELSRETAGLKNKKNAVPARQHIDYLEAVYAHSLAAHLVRLDKPEVENPALQEYENVLDQFYMVAKLKISCQKALQEQIYSLPFDPPYLPFRPDPNDWNYSTIPPLMALYLEAHRLTVLRQPESYDRLETMIYDQAGTIAAEELHWLMSCLRSYGSAQIRQGKTEFWAKAHALNKFSVEKSILLSNVDLSSVMFHNIVNAACLMGDLDWADSFITTHGHRLPEEDDIRQDTVILARAIILFEKKDFKGVITALPDTDFKILFDAIRAKAFVLRSYYELEEDEAALHYCSNLSVYLNHKKRRSLEPTRALLNFISILKMLIRKNVDREKILEQIETVKPLFFGPWLLEKAKQYKRLF